MVDIFQEVDEEVRRERLQKLWDRYGYLFIALCVLIVAGVGGWRGYEYWQAKKAGESGIAYEQAVQLAQAGKHKEADAAFARIAAGGTAGYRVLARLREAAELAQTDRKAAVAAYDALAGDKNAGQVIEDLAAVRAGLLLIDSTPYSEMQKRLEPLTAAGRTFRHTARELLALSALKAGDLGAARKWTDMMMTDPETPGGTRSRAQILSDLIAASGSKG
ncbi:MAG: tetratricopeptide repeat protein [Xanthobacteraceae bacterium]